MSLPGLAKIALCPLLLQERPKMVLRGEPSNVPKSDNAGIFIMCLRFK
jgi:hypothetical protein